MAFYDGEDISKAEQAEQWDEGVWGAGKEGVGVNVGDGHLHPLASSAAATRPNSPAPSTGGRSNLHPSSKQQEDDDFARAMAMSTGNLAESYQQETGIIGADGQQFGPANRNHYEKGQWDLVPTGVHNTSEIVPDTDTLQRVHTSGEPRLLKYLPTGDYTPNLLTICHAISGARQALLMRDRVQASYGQNEDWWRGEPISLPKIVNVEDQSAAYPESDKYDELLAEVQRLMAFLSASSRSYASVGALMNSEVMRFASPAYSTQSQTYLEHFIEQWTSGACGKLGEDSGMGRLFSTTVGTNASEGMHTSDMTLIDMQVDIPQDGKSDLPEQLDELLWDTKADNTVMSDNFIEEPAEVLVMRARQQNSTANPQLRLEVPPEFYVDKYLQQNIEATRATRTQMADGRKRIAKIEEIEKKLKTWKHPKKNEQLDATLLLKHTSGHFSGQNRIDVMNADKTAHMSEEMKPAPPHYNDIAQKLEKVISSIDNKLKVLSEEKGKTRKAIADMSRAPPSGLQPEDMKHRYTLRGVATKPNITYVLCPTDHGAEDEMHDDDSTPPGMRWWRMDYDISANGARLTKTKAEDYDVLRAVELEHSSALLVYASDLMNNAPDDGALPDPLAEFVRRDNDLFLQELQREKEKPPSYDLTDVPRESVERGSMDSTRVEAGGGSDHGAPSPPRYHENGFMDHPQFGLGHEIKNGIGLTDDTDDDAEVHEIRLDPPEDEAIEMIEKPREPRSVAGSSDTLMEDVS